MKFLFLNLWNGQLLEELRAFLSQVGQEQDILCFQEATTEEVRKVCRDLLPHYQEYVAIKGTDVTGVYAQATYVHPRFTVTEVTELLQTEAAVGLALSLRVTAGKRSYTVINLHGVSRAYVNGKGLTNDEKSDFPVRVRQFEIIRDFARTQGDTVIIGGDFNVLPQTHSIEMFQEAGYRDLIKEYHIPTTRNDLAWKNYPKPYFFSDYVFTSPTVQVHRFEVLDRVEVSDHLPLLLEID